MKYSKLKVAVAVNYAIDKKGFKQNKIAEMCSVVPSTVNSWKNGVLNAEYNKIKPLLDAIGPLPSDVTNHYFVVFPNDFMLEYSLMDEIISSLDDLEYPYSNKYDEILGHIKNKYSEIKYPDVFDFIQAIHNDEWINEIITNSKGQYIPFQICKQCNDRIRERPHNIAPFTHKTILLQWLLFMIVSKLQKDVIVTGDLIYKKSIKNISSSVLGDSIFTEYKVNVLDLLDGTVLLVEGFKTDYQDRYENNTLMENWMNIKYGPMTPQNLIDFVKNRSKSLDLKVSRSLSFLIKEELIKRGFQVSVDEIIAGRNNI